MVYTAVLVACLAIRPDPVGCRTHEMVIEASPIPTVAFLEAQSVAALWLANRPELTQLSLTIEPGRGA